MQLTLFNHDFRKRAEVRTYAERCIKYGILSNRCHCEVETTDNKHHCFIVTVHYRQYRISGRTVELRESCKISVETETDYDTKLG